MLLGAFTEESLLATKKLSWFSKLPMNEGCAAAGGGADPFIVLLLTCIMGFGTGFCPRNKALILLISLLERVDAWLIPI